MIRYWNFCRLNHLAPLPTPECPVPHMVWIWNLTPEALLNKICFHITYKYFTHQTSFSLTSEKIDKCCNQSTSFARKTYWGKFQSDTTSRPQDKAWLLFSPMNLCLSILTILIRRRFLDAWRLSDGGILISKYYYLNLAL